MSLRTETIRYIAKGIKKRMDSKGVDITNVLGRMKKLIKKLRPLSRGN